MSPERCSSSHQSSISIGDRYCYSPYRSQFQLSCHRLSKRKAIAALQAIAKSRNQLLEPVALRAPVEAIENLLSDLGESNASSQLRQQLIHHNSVPSGEQVHLVDTTQLAAMSMTFEVI